MGEARGEQLSLVHLYEFRPQFTSEANAQCQMQEVVVRPWVSNLYTQDQNAGFCRISLYLRCCLVKGLEQLQCSARKWVIWWASPIMIYAISYEYISWHCAFSWDSIEKRFIKYKFEYSFNVLQIKIFDFPDAWIIYEIKTRLTVLPKVA